MNNEDYNYVVIEDMRRGQDTSYLKLTDEQFWLFQWLLDEGYIDNCEVNIIDDPSQLWKTVE